MPVTLVILLSYTTFNLFMVLNKRVEQEWRFLFTDWLGDLFWKQEWVDYVNEAKADIKDYPLGRICLAVMIGFAKFLAILILTLTLIFPYRIYQRAFSKPKTKRRMYKGYYDIESQSSWDYEPLIPIHIAPSLSFTPSASDVFYVNNNPNSIESVYVRIHYDEICDRFKRFNFITREEVKTVVEQEELVQYLFPFHKSQAPVISPASDMLKIIDELEEIAPKTPCLVHYRPFPPDHKNYGKYYQFNFFQLNAHSRISLEDQIQYFANTVTTIPIGKDGPYALYHLSKRPADETADVGFSGSKAEKLMDEVRERIEKLRRIGIRYDQLLALIDEKPVLSRLVITKDFRILLPDYNNKEIKMSPLPKAVFLLFLKHPEGIVFKQLHDYYSELMGIYKQLTNRVVEIGIRKSIRDLTDPTKNSINEKCSRIREAFLKEFDDRFAHHYYVTGKYGEPKKIILPRELVEWEE